jgi:hypothetical protein
MREATHHAALRGRDFGSLCPLRCHAYLIRSERYLDVEEVLMQQLANASRDQLLGTIGPDFTRIELLSGEWRVLFTQARVTDSYGPVASDSLRIARLMAAPDQLAPLVNTLWMHELHDRWRSITFGLQHLTYALPLASGLTGAVFLEENDTWLGAEPSYEILAIHPEVYGLLAPFIKKLVDRGDYTMLARLVADHCESSIEFTADRWLGLREQSQARAPELVKMIDGQLTPPEHYEQVIAAMRKMLDAHLQPSLDAWLRVHAERAKYALMFRDIRREAGAARATMPFLAVAG